MFDRKIFDERIYYLRGLAIVLVALCHCYYDNEVYQHAVSIVGTIGVPVFFICTGLYFEYKTWKAYFIRTIRKIIVPWMVWGAITYLWTIRCGAIPSLSSLLIWISGYGTWLWFVPVYILCTMLMNFACGFKNKERIILTLYIVITLFFIFLHGIGIITFTKMTYLNPLNWIGFCSLGKILEICDIKRKELSSINTKLLFLLMTEIAIFVLYFRFTSSGSYFNLFSVPFEIIGALLSFTVFKCFNSEILKDIGKNSYVIFFAHMQFGIGYSASAINLVYSISSILGQILLFLWPLLAVILVYAGLVIVRFVFKKLNMSKFLMFFGIV